MQYSQEVKDKVKDYYLKQAKKQYEKGKNPKAVARQAATRTYEKFSSEEDPSKSQMKTWTSEYRDNNGNFDFSYFEGEAGAVEEGQEEGEDSRYHDKPYVFDGDNYYIPVADSDDIAVFTEEEVKKILEFYSNWTGNQDTKGKVCRKVGISPELFKEIKNKIGFIHDTAPFTNEEMVEKSTGEKLGELLKKRERELKREYQDKLYKQVEKEAKSYREIKQGKLNPIIEELKEDIPTYSVPNIKIEDKGKDLIYTVNLNDVHVGAEGVEDETGEEYNIEIARNRVISLGEELLGKFRKNGKPEKIIVSTGGDFFHVDGSFQNTRQGETTYGTLLDTCARPAKIGVAGFHIARDFVDIMRQVGVPVEIVVVGGNHDKVVSRLMAEYLVAWYRKQEDIEVASTYMTRKYAMYGDNLLAFAHGKDLKDKNLGKLMPNEAPELWGKTKSHFFIIQHKHALKVDDSDVSGVTIIRGSALSGTDDYHYKNGWIGATKSLNSFVFYKDGGLHDNLNASV